MEEATFLRAMDGVVGSVQVENQLLRGFLLTVEKDVDKEPVYRFPIQDDAPVPVALSLSGQSPLQPVQRAFPGQRLASVRRLAPIQPRGVAFARQGRQERIFAQLLVVAQVLIAERDPINPLPDQLLDAVLYQPGIPEVDEARSQSPQDASLGLHLAQQQGPTIRAQPSTIETCFHLPPAVALKLELRRSTVCRQGLLLALRLSVWSHNHLYQTRQPFLPFW